MHILVRSADLLQSSAIFYNHLQSFAIIWIILMIRDVSIIYVLRSTQKALRATLPCGCFLVVYDILFCVENLVKKSERSCFNVKWEEARMISYKTL